MAPAKRSVTRTLLSPLGLFAGMVVTGGLVAAGCIIDWADDCAHNRDAIGCKGGLIGTAGVGGTTSSSSGTGSSGGSDGGPTGCMEASTCPAVPAGPCASLGMKTCMGGVCGVTYTAGKAPSQVYGNCQQNVCDAMGVETSMPDDSNVFVSGNPCDNWSCANGVLSTTPMAGMPCSTWLGAMPGFCEKDPDPDGSGDLICSECQLGAAMPCMPTLEPLCISGTCVPSTCHDNTIDNGETDVDCGGGDCICDSPSGCGCTTPSGCLPCGDEKMCVKGSDCFSGVCSGTPRVCQIPTCSDNVKNGRETDVDCGGNNPLCQRCQPTQTCLVPSDCESGVCGPPLQLGQPATCKAPTCTDGVKNGGETGVDCGGEDADGGPPCPPCGDGGP